MLGVAYVAVIGAGFIANRTTKDPVTDPHLAIAEVLILTMAPVLPTLSAAIHHSVPADVRPYTLISIGWMVAAVATTSIVHLVELVVARRRSIGIFGYAVVFPATCIPPQ